MVYDMPRLYEPLRVVSGGVQVPLCVYTSAQLFCLQATSNPDSDSDFLKVTGSLKCPTGLAEET